MGKGKAVFTKRSSITEEGVTLTVVCQTVVCVYVHLHSGHSLSCMGRDGGGAVCRSYSLLAVCSHDTHHGLGRRSVSGVHIATRQQLSARSNRKTVTVLVLQPMQVLEDLELKVTSLLTHRLIACYAARTHVQSRTQNHLVSRHTARAGHKTSRSPWVEFYGVRFKTILT